MTGQIEILSLTAASIGFLHTLAGPDHYLPFIMMARANKWSRFKTALITSACGIGHVASSVILGFIGVAFGIALSRLELVESMRSNFAAWMLVAFGFVYLVWGIRQAIKNRPHTHFHVHEENCIHSHEHVHVEKHSHVHEEKNTKLTPWIMFVVFVFGPCEPLIPILMYPVASENISGLLIVTAIFGITTITTMLASVLIATSGLNIIPLKRFERYTHALAGGAIAICGLSIIFFGL